LLCAADAAMSATPAEIAGRPFFGDVAPEWLDSRTREILAHRRALAWPKRRGWLMRRALLLVDLIGLVLAFLAAEVLHGGAAQERVDSSQEYALFVLTLPVWLLVAKLLGLYDRDEERADHSTVDEIVGVLHLVTIGTWLVFVGAWLTGVVQPNAERLITFWFLAIASIALGRSVARAYCRRQIAYVQNTVIVGAGDVGQMIARKLLAHPEYGINVAGFVDSEPRERRDDLRHLTLLGPPERLPELIALLDVERVIIAFSNERHQETLALVRSLKDFDVQVDIVPRLFEVVGTKVGVHKVEGIPLVGLPPLRLSGSSRLVKRVLDVSLSVIGLVFLAPLFCLLALLIKLESPGPVFFRQVRMGSRGRTFRIFKFRTMTADAEDRKGEVAHLNMHTRNGGDPRMFKIPNDPRVTKLGAFLRRTSIDELPQMINVVKGEMSLVGPRPLILDEDRHVAQWARKRMDLKPGITGLWQVLGRSEIPFEEMTKLDYLYVTNWSLSEDLRLIVRTLPALLRPRNAY
jgi:exopolysaccharide biosynthesis polyprenyl glycosylphosphotransferase